MSLDLRGLAEEKRSETGHADWLKVLETAHSSVKIFASDEAGFRQLVQASRSPESFTILTRLMYQFTKAHLGGENILEILFERVNRSPFSLPDWLEATEFFYAWLSARKRKIDFLPMIQYLECCVAAPDTEASRQTLRFIVEDMLKTFDYEAG